MEQGKVDLSRYNGKEFDIGASKLKFALWQLCNIIFFLSPFNPSSKLKVKILRLFGANMGKGIVMNKPHINIKFPWRLTVGNYVWLGEQSWILNLAPVVIGDNVNIAQGAMLLTGNHNYKSVEFETTIAPITIEDGVFIGAKSVVCPGVTCKSHSILAVGSVATSDLEAYKIYMGVPAVYKKDRVVMERSELEKQKKDLVNEFG